MSKARDKVRKKEHYVSQFYLRRFTQDGHRLFVFDKFTRKSFASNIWNVASEKYFYDFPDDIAHKLGIDPQTVENALSDFESGFSNTIDSILQRIQSKSERVIKSCHKTVISHFIGLQSMRTKEHRYSQTELIEKGIEAVLTKTSDYSPDEYKVQVNREYVSLLQSMTMFDPYFQKLLTDVLNNHIWLVGINETTQPLYTSDSPVVKRPHKRDPFEIRSYAGFDSEGIEIALPLTPKYILILCERTFHKYVATREGKSIPINDDNVTYYNSLQVAQSYRQVYCPFDNLDLAQKMCDEHPELCTPDRTRVLVY